MVSIFTVEDGKYPVAFPLYPMVALLPTEKAAFLCAYSKRPFERHSLSLCCPVCKTNSGSAAEQLHPVLYEMWGRANNCV